MTDNYNDDYREVIPEEEKTETTIPMISTSLTDRTDSPTSAL